MEKIYTLMVSESGINYLEEDDVLEDIYHNIEMISEKLDRLYYVVCRLSLDSDEQEEDNPYDICKEDLAF